MVSAKTLGGIQLVGALVAGWLGYSAGRWDSLVFALVFLVMAYHHLTER